MLDQLFHSLRGIELGKIERCNTFHVASVKVGTVFDQLLRVGYIVNLGRFM